MVEYWKYIGKMLLPSDIDPKIKDEWEATLKNEQVRIKHALDTKIPDESSYRDKIGDASSDAFSDFLATVGGKWNVDMIETKQRVKLYARYPAWDAGIEACFGVGGYFGDRVTSKKAKVTELRRVIGVVGHKALGSWNPASMAVLLLRGDTRCARYFDTNDSFAGTLESVVDALKGALITPSLLAEMIQACVVAKYANEGGLTAIRNAIITASNARLDELLQVALDSAHLTPPKDVTVVLSWSAPDDNLIVTVTDTH